MQNIQATVGSLVLTGTWAGVGQEGHEVAVASLNSTALEQMQRQSDCNRSPVRGAGVRHGVAVVAVRVHLQHNGA